MAVELPSWADEESASVKVLVEGDDLSDDCVGVELWDPRWVSLSSGNKLDRFGDAKESRWVEKRKMEGSKLTLQGLG